MGLGDQLRAAENDTGRRHRDEARRRWREEAARVGDRLQSEASRLAEFVRKIEEEDPFGEVIPYEVRMALFEIETAVAEWTELRRAWRGLR